MRTIRPVRGLSMLPLLIAIASVFACSESPTQPGPLDDSTVVSRSRSFDAGPTGSGRAESLDEPGAETDYLEAETDYLEEELIEGSELMAEGAELDDASDLDVNDLDTSALDANGLTAGAPRAATKRTVALSGYVKDKNTGRTIRGVTVKITGIAPVTSNTRGFYLINVLPSSSKKTIKFSKTGYTTKNVTKAVTRTVEMSDVFLTPSVTATALKSVLLNDSNVPVGTVVTATVKLTKDAPKGGVTISVSSTSPGVATVSTTNVTIAAGASSKTFKVTAKSPGTTSIKATYKGSKTAQLNVMVVDPGGTTGGGAGGGGTEIVDAKFTYDPSPCLIVEGPGGDAPLRATCIFDASKSIAPAGSTYTWTLPGGKKVERDSPRLLNAPLPCGLDDGRFPGKVSLTVTSPGNVSDSTGPISVEFSKDGPC